MNGINIIAMTGSPEGGGGGFAGMLPFIMIIFIIYFLMIRPQSKKAKEHKMMLTELKKGDKVVTIGGIFGVIMEVRERTFLLKVSSNSDLEILKSSVSERFSESKVQETVKQ